MVLAESIYGQAGSDHKASCNYVTISCGMSHVPAACWWNRSGKVGMLRKQGLHHCLVMKPARIQQFFLDGAPLHQQIKDRLMTE